jgi:hypothetical protein
LSGSMVNRLGTGGIHPWDASWGGTRGAIFPKDSGATSEPELFGSGRF